MYLSFFRLNKSFYILPIPKFILLLLERKFYIQSYFYKLGVKIKKRIFITGVAGFLGSHLAEEMIREGYEVVGCDNLLGGYLDNVPSKVEF